MEIRADLKYTSEAQKVADADQLFQHAVSVPYFQQNSAFMHAAAKKMLEARDQHDMVNLLGPDPAPPQTPLGFPAPPQEQQAGASGPSGTVPTGPPQ